MDFSAPVSLMNRFRLTGAFPATALSALAGPTRGVPRVGEDGHDVAAVAVEYGVGWHTVMRAVRDHGRPLVKEPARLAGVTAVGVDETAFLAATSRHHTEFITGIVDLTGHLAGR